MIDTQIRAGVAVASKLRTIAADLHGQGVALSDVAAHRFMGRDPAAARLLRSVITKLESIASSAQGVDDSLAGALHARVTGNAFYSMPTNQLALDAQQLRGAATLIDSVDNAAQRFAAEGSTPEAAHRAFQQLDSAHQALFATPVNDGFPQPFELAERMISSAMDQYRPMAHDYRIGQAEAAQRALNVALDGLTTPPAALVAAREQLIDGIAALR